jgi:hypothetical protein
MTTLAQPLDLSGIDAAEAAFLRAQQRQRWRRRMLPFLGIAAALLVWAALVYIF